MFSHGINLIKALRFIRFLSIKNDVWPSLNNTKINKIEWYHYKYNSKHENVKNNK
ncbi:hypothetical protein CREGCYN_07880 [Synechococcus sp. M16CYN]